MRRRLISILLLLSFCAANFQIAFAEELLNIDDNNISITESGDYVITGTSSENVIVIGDLDSEERIAVNLTLQDVNITSAEESPLLIHKNADVELTLSGTNTLINTKNVAASASASGRKAGLGVCSSLDGSMKAVLTINGSGSLTAEGGSYGVGIGASAVGTTSFTQGDIIINGGTITAAGGTGAAGIGVLYNNTSGINGSITINGGAVAATGGKNAAGIGSSYNGGRNESIKITGGSVTAIGNGNAADIGGHTTASGTNGPIFIEGGYVKAAGTLRIGCGFKATQSNKIADVVITGGSVDGTVYNPDFISATNGNDIVSQIILTMPDAENHKNEEVIMNGHTAITDDKAKLYPFVPASADRIFVQIGEDTYYADIADGTSEYDLSLLVEEECTCAQDTASIQFELPQTIEVNILKEYETVHLNAKFIPDENCEKKQHEQVSYELTVDGADDLTDIAEISNDNLTVYKKALGKTIHIKAAASNNGIDFISEKDIEVISNDDVELDLVNGDIVISDIENGKHKITVGSTEYVFDADKEIIVIQSNSENRTTSHTVSVEAAAAFIVLKDININVSNKSAISVADDSSVSIKLEGNNKLAARTETALSGMPQSSLTIGGTGSLEASSVSAAGIGGFKNITINDGIITAAGGGGAAGIGGISGYSASAVTINGGKITASGSGSAAGIGAGSQTDTVQNPRGADVIINGGTVKATSEQGYGIGGAGGTRHGSSYHGSVTINAGSVNSTGIYAFGVSDTNVVNNSGETVALCTLTIDGITDERDVEYTIDTGEKIKTSTDSEGRLYLYLTKEEHQIKVYDGGTVYYERIKIKGSGNEGICSANPVKELKSFEIAGQQAVIDNENKTITIDIQYNLDLSNAMPKYEFEGYSFTPSTDDFSTSDTITYTLRGDDDTDEVYTLIINRTNKPDTEQDIYDISKGDVVIYSDRVDYEGTRFLPNPKGYIITGTTDKYKVVIDNIKNPDETPNVIFKDLHIDYQGANVPAVRVYVSANITLEGNNTLSSADLPGIELYKGYSSTKEINLNISGSGNLTVKGGTQSPAIGSKDDSFSAISTAAVTGTGVIILEGADGKNAVSGELITDSVTNIRLIDKNEEAVTNAVNASGDRLYQATVTIRDNTAANKTCTYKNTTYSLDDDAAFYLMLPNNTYTMQAVYNATEFNGRATIQDAPVSATLRCIGIEDIEFSSIAFDAQKADFEVVGYIEPEKTKVRLVPTDSENYQTIEANVEIKNDRQIASVEFPVNELPDPIEYTVYGIINNEEVYTSEDKFAVNGNDTLCQITKFEISGQFGETTITHPVEEGRTGRITVYFPFDHIPLATYYKPDIEHEGLSIYTASQSGSQTFFNPSAEYTVTAKNGITTKKYRATVMSIDAPVINEIKFDNPSTNAETEITVTLTGENLENIDYAEKESSKIITVYADGINAAEAVEKQDEFGSIYYEAIISVPENTDDSSAKEYQLKVKIGDTEQKLKSDSKLSVPRKKKSASAITEFTLENQIGNTVFNGTNISITVPYDADITSLLPDLSISENASYQPQGAQNFSSPVGYTVTAEDGEHTTQYTVKVTKQAAPTVSSIKFENPQYGLGGTVAIELNGENFDNLNNAVNSPKTIAVKAALIGTTASEIIAYASKNENGKYTANIIIPRNDDAENEKKYQLSVEVGGVKQTLSGNSVLTVPKGGMQGKEITSITLAGASGTAASDNTFTVSVPYNTDLRNITPVIEHTGVDCSPKGPQNFNNTVDYTITNSNGASEVYHIKAERAGTPEIDTLSINKTPANFADTNVGISISGKFVPYLTQEDKNAGRMKDSVVVRAVSSEGGEPVTASIEYTQYSGAATGVFTLPKNTTTKDVTYTISALVNGVSQDIGSEKTITVPGRKPRTITSFAINGLETTGIEEVSENEGIIKLNAPYEADLKELTPDIEINGDDYEPKGAQDFTKSVIYTVSATADTPRKYTVQVTRTGTPVLKNVQISNLPKNFNGSTVDVNFSGIFYKSAEVTAVPADGNGESIQGKVTMTEEGRAAAKFDIPANTDTVSEKQYKLVFTLDGYKDIAYDGDRIITVPRRKTRAITSFYVQNQIGNAAISDSKVSFIIPYDTDLSDITPEIECDGDYYTPTGAQNFANETRSLQYSIYADGDEPRIYTITAVRDGEPFISNVSCNDIDDFNGGKVTLTLTGTFLEGITATADEKNGGVVIQGKVISVDDDNAVIEIEIPKNESTNEDKVYAVKFIIDDIELPYQKNITVPRRTSRQITEFTLCDAQEGDTRIDGTDIYVDVPYNLDLTALTPQITYDADTITPTGAQDFGDTDNPVKYVLSSKGDDSITYTVRITKVGEDPYIKTFTVDKQAKDTEYDGDNIKITLKANSKLNAIEPDIEFVGSGYLPEGPQDFTNSVKNPVEYTVYNKYGIEHKYYVSINKKSSDAGSADKAAGASKPTAMPSPTPEATLEPTAAPTFEPAQTPQASNIPDDGKNNIIYMHGYDEDGTIRFKPDSEMTRAEVATILSILDSDFNEYIVYQNVFEDVEENAWYGNYVNFASGKGYITGYEDGMYKPDNMITRAEFAVMLSRYMNISDLDSEDKFSDISDLYWCREQINALYNLGIVKGYGGMFMPNNIITRAEAVVMINRMLKRDTSDEKLEEIVCPFSDVSDLHWAYKDIILSSCEY